MTAWEAFAALPFFVGAGVLIGLAAVGIVQVIRDVMAPSDPENPYDL